MKRGSVAAILGALASAPAACTALVGLESAPTMRDVGAPNGTSEAGEPAVVEGGAEQTDTGAVDAPPMDAPPVDAPPMDAPPMDAPPMDAPPMDATGDRAPDGGIDGGPALLVLNPSVLRLLGITSDGWVLYQDPSDNGTHAVSLAGGPPVLVVPALEYVTVQGRVAFIVPPSTSQPILTVWTSATGAHAQPYVSGTPSFGTLMASLDGSRIVYVANDPAQDAGSYLYRLVEADPDFSNPITLAPVWGAQSTVYTAEGRFVVSSDLPATDGGSYYTCDSYTNSGVKTHLFDSWCNSAGRQAIGVVEGPGGLVELLSQSVTGGMITAFGPDHGDAGAIRNFSSTPDGRDVVFADTAGSFWSFSVASSITTALPDAGGFQQFSSLVMSPDGSHFYYGTANKSLLVAKTTAGNAFPLHSRANGPITYLTFGSDSRSLIFLEGHELELTSLDTTVTVHVANDVTCDQQTQYDCFLPAHDSRIVYLSGGDLWSVDASDLPHPTMLARSVVQFMVDPAGTTVAYRFKDSSLDNRSGLYSVAVP